MIMATDYPIHAISAYKREAIHVPGKSHTVKLISVSHIGFYFDSGYIQDVETEDLQNAMPNQQEEGANLQVSILYQFLLVLNICGHQSNFSSRCLINIFNFSFQIKDEGEGMAVDVLHDWWRSNKEVQEHDVEVMEEDEADQHPAA